MTGRPVSRSKPRNSFTSVPLPTSDRTSYFPICAGTAAGTTGPSVRGWQVNSIFTARDGWPVYVTASSNLSGSFSTIQYANLNGDPSLPASQRTLQHWFNTAAFSIPATYTFGNAGPF